MKKLLLIITLMSLLACSTPEEREHEQRMRDVEYYDALSKTESYVTLKLVLHELQCELNHRDSLIQSGLSYHKVRRYN